MNAPMATIGGYVCKICRFEGSDLRIAGCGCTIHAVSFPLVVIVEQNSGRRDVRRVHLPNRNLKFDSMIFITVLYIEADTYCLV
jgi:hypothetical protein